MSIVVFPRGRRGPLEPLPSSYLGVSIYTFLTTWSEPGAIGMIDVHSVDNSINVVHVDGKLPMEFGYLPH